MLIAGIDYSLCGPAICVYRGEITDTFSFNKCKFYYLTDTKKYAKTISAWAADVCYGCEQVGLEGYAYGAKGRVFHIAENTGILKYKFFQNNIPVEVITPSEVKKRACGKGNANKADMHSAFQRETSHNLAKIITPDKTGVTNPVSDIVDAYFVCKCLYDNIKYTMI